MNDDKKISNEENAEDINVNEEQFENTETDNEEHNDVPAVDIEKVMEENKKLKDVFLRAYADAENVKKRCQQEMEKSVKFAVADFAKNLLPVADNLQRALDAADKDENSEKVNSLRKGIELTQSELVKVFNKFGIHKMDIMGKVFDPNFHQVVQEVPTEGKESGTIIAEIQTGYMIHDRILREAMVVVAK